MQSVASESTLPVMMLAYVRYTIRHVALAQPWPTARQHASGSFHCGALRASLAQQLRASFSDGVSSRSTDAARRMSEVKLTARAGEAMLTPQTA